MTEETREERNVLAAEYVIGLTSRLEREAASRRLLQDAEFSAQVDWWTQKLGALNAEFAPVKPPAWIKKRIDKRLFGARKRGWFPWFFMGLGVASFVVTLVLGLLTAMDAPDLRAQLSGDEASFEVEVGEMLTITRLSGDLAADRVYELWLIPEDSAPQSLGTFGVDGTLDVAGLEAGATLAVSLEPLGGSPTGAPTGPVLAVGVLEDV